MVSILSNGNLAPGEYFTGKVLLNLAVTPEDNLVSVVSKVTFEPKARTNWHMHPYGQILIVTEGAGYYQEKDKPAQLIKTGDVVKIPADADHWHGAAHNSGMTHIALVPPGKNSTIWGAPVTDSVYNAVNVPESKPSPALNITEKATGNRETLWPGYQSAVNITDPELAELFDNFAFDEVISHDTMDPQTRIMLILAATIASQSVTAYTMMLNAALNTGVSPVAIKEIVYQAVPYTGMAKVTDFIHATNEVFTQRGIPQATERQSTTTRETRQEAGLVKQMEIFSSSIDTAYKNSPKDLLHIQQYLTANCFGDYLTRNGLDVKTREMITLSFLVTLGGTEPQIKGHIQGNANVGNDRQTLINLLTQLLPYIGYPRILNAITCLNEILPPIKTKEIMNTAKNSEAVPKDVL
ncbi:cupin domain-containing carboxymuconolactone decarboxylase family protein [Deminuibacter soli]|uniref:Cupin domain-containing protein n=1 Tax=Deminuibacter soli TaxID=2291815 RepID=A0A3E1NMW5_9BACT|nr:carboxymuconolactone decarboxylase family protein [Deminuibacter soli]RFM29174.1 cupin domain-containing protein [Deminuibacter soli]